MQRELSSLLSCNVNQADVRTAYFSYGGLLMALRGSYRHLSKLVVGENIYLLIRK